MAARRKKSASAKSKKKSKRKKRKKASRSFAWGKLLALVCLVGLLAGAGAFLYYYSHFSRLIDAHLEEHPSGATAIYSRPLEVRRGQVLAPGELARQLSLMGYKSGRELSQGEWYVRSGPRFAIGQQRGARNVRLAIGFNAAGRVVALQEEGRVVDRLLLKGQFLSNLFGAEREKRRRVEFEDLPQHLVEAVLAAEDRDFFHHIGIDFTGIARAAWVNLMRGEKAQGGSTLTQQFVKNFFLTPRKTIKRKLEEMFLAVLLENRFTKTEIFRLYSDEVYLGQADSFAVKGFGQASLVFFGKNIREITLPEAALLAGIIQAPNRFSPRRNIDAALERRDHVLKLMRAHDFISEEQLRQARTARPQIAAPAGQDSIGAPYFVDHLRARLEERVSLPQHGFRSLEIYSTLDPELQRAAFEAVREGLARVARARPEDGKQAQAALIALDPRNGGILAMIGGRSYSLSQFNRAVHALRQPGSTFKPFVYATALRTGISPANGFHTLARFLEDRPYTFAYEGREYTPGNYSGRYRGRVSLRNALALSLNVPTVKLAEEVGFQAVADTAGDLGIERGLKPYPSIALGTFELSLLDLARGYSVFANQGRLAPIATIRRIERDGRELDLESPPQRQVLAPETAFLINSALGSVLSYGTGKSVRRQGFDLPAAGKTGSTDDAWFVGYTPDLLCAVWVGFDDSRPLNMSGTRAALPIWTRFMKQSRRLGHLSGAPFPRPEGILAVEIDRRTGLKASSKCRSTYTEYFIKGTEPVRRCLQHQLSVER